MNNDIGRVCPVCKQAIGEQDAGIVRDQSGVLYHEHCVQVKEPVGAMAGQTATPQPTQAIPTPQPTAQPHTGSVQQPVTHQGALPQQQPAMSPQQPVQSQQPAVQPQTMPGTQPNMCGTQGASNGYGATPPRKKNKLIPIIAAVLVVAIAVGGFLVYSNNKAKAEQAAREAEEARQLQEAIDTYKADTAEFCKTTLASGVALEDIGNTIHSYWYKQIYNSTYSSIDAAVRAAQLKEATKISQVKNNHTQISTLYNKLLTLPDTENDELQQLRDAVKDLYSAYEELYQCVINVSGNYASYVSEFKRTDSNMSLKYKALYSLVEKYKSNSNTN